MPVESHAAEVETRVRLGALSLANPILAASGCFGYGEELRAFGDVARLGAVIGKTITLEPRHGNHPPRTVETASGMLNAIGLQNPGIARYIDEKLPFLSSLGSPVITSIAGIREREFVDLAARLDAVAARGDPTRRVDALELNLSCPNIEAGGFTFACDPSMTEGIVARVRQVTRLPLIAKLSPNVTDVRVPARAAEAGGADALSLVNTLVGMAVDWRRRRPRLANKTGGLSGPAIKPVALWQVHAAASVVSIPVIGIGGIVSLDDVLEFIVAGASAVQIGTATFADPGLAMRLVDELPPALAREGIQRLDDIIGSLAPHPDAGAAGGREQGSRP